MRLMPYLIPRLSVLLYSSPLTFQLPVSPRFAQSLRATPQPPPPTHTFEPQYQAGAVLGSTGFGYARNPATGEYVAFPQQGTLVIGDDVEIGANTAIDRGALGETRIGAGTKIDN